MGVKSVATSWARSQFGDDAAEVTRRVVRALATWHQSGLDAQAGSRMTKKYPYGAVWSAMTGNVVDELQDMDGAEVIPVPGPPGYRLIKLQSKVLVPFKLATTLAVHHSQAKIASGVLRDLTALSVPRPVPPPSLLDGTEFAPAPPPQRSGREEWAAIIPSDTPIIYIGVVANADSKSLLAAWWGIGTALDTDGRLTWSPEQLPLDVLVPGDVPTVVPEPRPSDRLPSFDQGPVPPMTFEARSRPVDPAASDDRE